MILVDSGVEGIEWFVGSDLSQWELQLAGRRGPGRCRLEPSLDPPGLALSISPLWRDGSYPPYPDMDRYDKVLDDCRRAGIRTATYFSNKKLHPSTKEFQEHGQTWSRKNRKGDLRHNFYRRPDREFSVQMCLRSGWLDFLKFSNDRLLKNHPLDGVYYDWNVALFCCNPLHEADHDGTEPAKGHWDMDELLELMEWTRRRVGPDGLIIVHNTKVPMYAMENFADWRNQAVTLSGARCASAVYSRTGEAYLLLANLDQNPRENRTVIFRTVLTATDYPCPQRRFLGCSEKLGFGVLPYVGSDCGTSRVFSTFTRAASADR